jgi:MoxR-like ATPase
MPSIPEQIQNSLSKVIQGKNEIIERVLVALLADGHLLIEDVPGVGKTTLAKALARCIEGVFHRIQFTPDLLPTDIVGGMVYSPATGDFTFRSGPVFCNVLLADEINRASPRTQSALLEAMNERQVTIEGVAHQLQNPFIVIATQNPIEHHGTYPLPEAQLDRFAMQIDLGYPQAEDEIRIVKSQRTGHPLDHIAPVADTNDIVQLQEQVRAIHVEDDVVAYLTEIVRATRTDTRLKLGASPRAALTLYRTGQARAFLNNRDYVLPDDIQQLAVPVLAHRIALDTRAQYAGTSAADVVKDILGSVPVPV